MMGMNSWFVDWFGWVELSKKLNKWNTLMKMFCWRWTERGKRDRIVQLVRCIPLKVEWFFSFFDWLDRDGAVCWCYRPRASRWPAFFRPVTTWAPWTDLSRWSSPSTIVYLLLQVQKSTATLPYDLISTVGNRSRWSRLLLWFDFDFLVLNRMRSFLKHGLFSWQWDRLQRCQIMSSVGNRSLCSRLLFYLISITYFLNLRCLQFIVMELRSTATLPDEVECDIGLFFCLTFPFTFFGMLNCSRNSYNRF